MNAYDKEVSFQSLKTLLAFGITTVRNPAAPTKDGLEIKELVSSDGIEGPEIFTTGYALNRVNGTFGPFSATPTTDAVRKEVRKQAALGVDFIKIYGSLKPHLTKAAIDEAHKLGVKVIGHLQNTTWTEASNLGIDYITHAAPWNKAYLPRHLRANYRPTFKGRTFWLENVDFQGPEIMEMLKSMQNNGVSVDPTLVVFHTKFWGDDDVYRNSEYLNITHPTIVGNWNRVTFTDDWTESDYARAKLQWPKLLSLTKLMYDNGIMLTTGSDFPNPWVVPGYSLHQEMEFMVEAGIEPVEVIRIATYNGAKALGIESRTGSIQVGMEVDMVFLNKNPIEDIGNTKEIVWVLKDGKRIVPGDMLTKH